MAVKFLKKVYLKIFSYDIKIHINLKNQNFTNIREKINLILIHVNNFYIIKNRLLQD